MSELKMSYDEHFALIIGINKYENLNDLEYAVNDAKSIKDVLINTFNYKEENITILLDKKATKENIMNAFYEISQKTCNDDSVLFFYAGHGITYQAGIKDKGYLVPYNGTEQNLNSLIGWNTLMDDSELFRAKHIFYVMDACYSGLALQRTARGSKRFLKDMLRRYGRQVLTAGKSDQTVKDSGGKTNNSIFTSYLLEALKGEAKIEYGVLSASSVMNYVYNKVSNDPKSYQTPGFGSFYGEGDFIFNFEEINNQLEKNDEKDNDILIEIPTSVINDQNRNQNEFVTELKRLLSDSKNFIKINDIINEEIRIYLSEFNKEKLELNSISDDIFKSRVIKNQKNISNLLYAIILLTYYGDEKYINLIKKIIYRVYPTGTFGGNSVAISLLYYPSLLLIYVAIISALESEKYEIIKEILSMNDNRIDTSRYYNDSEYLLINLFEKINYSSSYFKLFYPDKNYKYPMNEYLYKFLQPLIDDLLFIGDNYNDQYTNVELIISIFVATKKYNKNPKYAWGPTGRYIYLLSYGDKDISKLSINDIISKIGLYDSVEDKNDFINKYTSFLSKNYF